MTMTRRASFQDSFCMLTMEDMVPQDHMVRKIAAAFDFNFIYDEVASLYSPIGRPSIDPVVLFKILIINYMFNINSIRKTIEECRVNVAYRWFLGYHMNEAIPCYSVWSQNYRRRYHDKEVFRNIFYTILFRCDEKGFVDVTNIFQDGTHQKANANKNKSKKEIVELAAKEYEEELLKEINDDREMTGHKPVKSPTVKEIIFDEQTGEEIEVKNTKTVTVSTTDPDCGVFNKGEHERMMAYEHQVICDKNGFVIVTHVVPGNIHDSVSFFDAYREARKLFGERIKGIALDAGYKTPAICREILCDGLNAFMPYTRPKTKLGFLSKREYIYDEVLDIYLCPEDKELTYKLTNKEGYRIYESDPNDCINCPLLSKCTNSENHKKVIARHLWEGYVEEVEEIRYTDLWKQIYPLRKQTIERVFADGKEYHCLRYTRVWGLKKNQDCSYLLFAVHNLKKLALWSW